MVTTIVLFQGLSATVQQIITLVMGFLVICVGITVLQLSKIDPTQIKTLDRRSTLLLQAAKNNTEGVDEKNLAAVEDPGMDALRGSFGTMGSIIRARSARRMSMNSRASASVRSRYSVQPPTPGQTQRGHDPLAGLKRHQLFDNPMPNTPDAYDGDVDRLSMASHPSALGSPFTQRKQTIKFDKEDLVHSYHTPGKGDNTATHERRHVQHGSVDNAKYDSVSSSGWSAKAVVGANGEQTPAGEGVQVISLDDTSRDNLFDSSEPLTAPPALQSGTSTAAFLPPSAAPSPYDRHPSTAAASSFPPHPASATPPRSDSAVPLSPGARLRQLHLFGGGTPRSPSTRHYPRGDRDDDREESVSLWNGSNSYLDLESATEADFPQGGIRLVPNTRQPAGPP